MNRIKELRESLGLTQKEMAAAVKLSASTLARYEITNSAPVFVISRIAETYAVNPAWLAGWSDDDRPEKVVYVYPSQAFAEVQKENDRLRKALASREYSLSLYKRTWGGRENDTEV